MAGAPLLLRLGLARSMSACGAGGAPPSRSMSACGAGGAPRVRVAVIGGGASGCAAAQQLAGSELVESVDLFEIGRGLGGRATARRTREDPRICVSHGAPMFDIRSDRARALTQTLEASSHLKPFGGTVGSLDATGEFRADPSDSSVKLYTGVDGMGSLTEGLLSNTTVNCHFGSMVRDLTPMIDGDRLDGWQLLDKNGEKLGEAEWLVVTGSAIAHPRWSATFGGEAPLLNAARTSPVVRDDVVLQHALAQIAGVENDPLQVAMFALEGEASDQWAALPWSIARVEHDEVLSKIVVQTVDGGLTAIVAHSTHEFAKNAADVFGSTSSAARIGGAKADKAREAEILLQLLVRSVSLHTPAGHCTVQ
eukprot:COSAG02_NODE_3423_length_6770_cov_5.903912_2_plen_366_part_00